MPRSKQSFNKREKERKRQKQKQDKIEKSLQRKADSKKGQSLEDMLAYVDENGNLTSQQPDGKSSNREDDPAKK